VVDDFGRQLVQPKELLNRWIMPMEARVDHLTLLSGDTVEIPFECLLVFSTNLPPHSLGDEAFFRRIRHKIEVGDPDEQSFLRILQMMCADRQIPYAPEGGRYLIEKWYRPKERHFRGCHPRDDGPVDRYRLVPGTGCLRRTGSTWLARRTSSSTTEPNGSCTRRSGPHWSRLFASWL
jgi:hypothetical protein